MEGEPSSSVFDTVCDVSSSSSNDLFAFATLNSSNSHIVFISKIYESKRLKHRCHKTLDSCITLQSRHHLEFDYLLFGVGLEWAPPQLVDGDAIRLLPGHSLLLEHRPALLQLLLLLLKRLPHLLVPSLKLQHLKHALWVRFLVKKVTKFTNKKIALKCFL